METLKINGMSCGHCTGSVKKALEEIDGLSEVTVDLEGKEACFENSGAAREEIRGAISAIGFEPEE
ncbi:MAG: heavy-metal-associated domain-containing protein [Desulfobulbaceae bacterium]|nr:heavy-metal-associated domain-containing protein [Desulfobulbaceae bacterium]